MDAALLDVQQEALQAVHDAAAFIDGPFTSDVLMLLPTVCRRPATYHVRLTVEPFLLGYVRVDVTMFPAPAFSGAWYLADLGVPTTAVTSSRFVPEWADFIATTMQAYASAVTVIVCAHGLRVLVFHRNGRDDVRALLNSAVEQLA